MASKIEKQVVIVVSNKGLKETIRDAQNLGGATDRVAQSTDRFSASQREQRKANESVFRGADNTGKAFAKQQRTLGGLVKVYAVTAANIFALTAAYDVLKRSANFAILQDSAEQLSKSTGVNFSAVAQDLQQITGGALSAADALRTANLGISGGASRGQLSQITDIATKAANALGRNVPEAVDRMTQAVIKAEPELVDEFGIILRIKEASDAYASSIGKVASELNTFEKQQAIINQLIDQGTKKFSDIEAQANPFQQLSAGLANLSTEILQFIGGPLGALAGAIAKSGAAMAAGLVLIFNALIKQIIPSLKEMGTEATANANDALKDIQRLEKGAIKSAENLEKRNIARGRRRFNESKAVRKAEADIRKLDQDVDLFGGLEKDETLRVVARGGAAASGELLKAFQRDFRELGPSVRKQLDELDRLSVEGAKKIGRDLNKVFLRFGDKTTAVTRAQAEALLSQNARVVSELDKEFQTLSNKGTQSFEKIGEAIRDSSVEIAKFKVGVAKTSAEIAKNRAAIINAPSFGAASAEFGKILKTNNQLFEGNNKLARSFNVVGNTVVKARAGITLFARGLSTLVIGITQWVAIITIAFQGLKLLADALGFFNEEQEKAEEFTASFAEELKTLDETMGNLNTKLSLSALNVQDLADKYKFAANVTADLTTKINKQADALRVVGDAGIFEGFVFGTSEAEDSVLNMVKTIDAFNARFGKDEALKIKINGDEIKLTQKNIEDFTLALDDAFVRIDISEQARKISDGFNKVANSVAGATDDIKTSVETLNKSRSKVLEDFNRSLSTGESLSAISKMEQGLQDINKNLGTTAETSAAIINSLNETDVTQFGFSKEDKSEINRLNILNDTLFQVKNLGSVEEQFAALRKLFNNEAIQEEKELKAAIIETANALRDRIEVAQQVNRVTPFFLPDIEPIQDEADLKPVEDALSKRTAALQSAADDALSKTEERLAKAKQLAEQEATIVLNATDAAAQAGIARKRASSGNLEDLKRAANAEQANAAAKIAALKFQIQLVRDSVTETEKGDSLQEKAVAAKVNGLQAQINLERENVRLKTAGIAVLKDAVVQQNLVNKALRVNTNEQELSLKILETEQKLNLGSIEQRQDQTIAITKQRAEVLKSKQAEIKGQIAALKASESLATSEGKINTVKSLQIQINEKNLDLRKNELTAVENQIKLTQDLLKIEQERIKVANAQASLASKLQSFSQDISSNEELPAAVRLKALKSRSSIEDKATKLQINALEERKRFLRLEIASTDAGIKESDKQVKRLEILELQVEQAQLLINLGTKSLEQRTAENEIQQQALKEGAGNFGDALASNLDVVARDFNKTMRSEAQQVSDAIVGSIDKGVDSFVDNLSAFGKGDVSAGDAVKNTLTDIGNVIRDVAKESLKEDIKGAILSTFELEDRGATKASQLDIVNSTLELIESAELNTAEEVKMVARENTLLKILETMKSIDSKTERTPGVVAAGLPKTVTQEIDIDSIAEGVIKGSESIKRSENLTTNIDFESDNFFARSTEKSIAAQLKKAGTEESKNMDAERLASSLIKQVPRFAEGGVVNQPTIALIGESGAELIVPITSTGTPNIGGTVAQSANLSASGEGRPGVNFESLREGRTEFLIALESINKTLSDNAQCDCFKAVGDAIISAISINQQASTNANERRDSGFDPVAIGAIVGLGAKALVNSDFGKDIGSNITDFFGGGNSPEFQVKLDTAFKPTSNLTGAGGFSSSARSGFDIDNFNFGVMSGEVASLASGGIVSGPTPALVGESGQEAIIPLKDGNLTVKLEGEARDAPLAPSVAAASVKALVEVDRSLETVADQSAIQSSIATAQLSAQLAGNASIVSAISSGTSSIVSALGTLGTGISGGGANIGAAVAGAATSAVVSGVLSAALADGGIVNGGLSKIPKFQTGGITDSPEFALIGEGENSEAVVPLPDNRSIPVAFTGGGGNGDNTSVTVNINVTGVKDSGDLGKTASQIAAMAGRESKRAVRRNT